MLTLQGINFKLVLCSSHFRHFFVLAGITSDGEKEEFVNDANTLDQLDLFIPILKLVEKQGNQDEKLLNAEISNLIGRRLHDFDVMGAEVGMGWVDRWVWGG